MPERVASLPAVFLAPGKKRLSVWAYIFLFFLCVAFYAPGFVSLPPTDRDESSFAQSSKQMIESNNYVDIRIQEKPRYKKPIGIYWLQASSVKLLNPDHLKEIWAYRVPSFLGAATAVLMTAALGTFLFGPLAGILGAMMMAGCVVLNVEARMAKTDAALLGCIMVMQYGLAKAYIKRKEKFATSLAFWTALGLGVLIKGPIILLVLFSTLLWLWLQERKLKWFLTLRPAMGLPYALALIIPWFTLMILGSQGQFVDQSIGHDFIAKIWNGEFRGIIPPGVHLLALPVVFAPFALFAFLALPDIWRHRHEPAIRFCLGWIIPAWIVFELSLTKLPHYVMPLYPAIAMLAAKFLSDGFPALTKNIKPWFPALVMGLWLMICTGLLLALIYMPYALDQAWNAWQIGASALFFLSLNAALFFLMQRTPSRSVIALTIGSLIFMGVTFGITLPRLQHIWLSKQVAHIAERTKPCEKPEIITATYDEPSLVFLAGTETQFIASGAQAAFAVWLNPCRMALIDGNHKQLFLDVFAKARYKPIEVGHVEGLNTGRGRKVSLTLYTLPMEAKRQ
ncbi:MAG: glycosyltransferase family 39 protein [Alphaproteobacteria bacterium]|nr:glycosyltransferase family 39 protein [Alphaproteobacteria bacterium]